MPSTSGLSADEIAGGLKEALQKGAQTGTAKLSSPGGFLENAALKIIMPPEARKIETTLRRLGFNQLMDDMIVSMNRAAEDACKTAVPIFTTAIREMTITDGINILRGSDTSATSYLRSKTNTALAQSFSPVIKSALDKVNALNGVLYTWNEKSIEHGFKDEVDDTVEAGLLAQEVQAVLPEVVVPAPFDYINGESASGEDYLTVKYERIVPLLVEAIKEADVKAEAQAEEIAELRTMVQKLLDK